jgi:aldehyde:ferredoxin oxidoreductase
LIGRLEGFENLLADGVQRSADHIGHNSDRFAINISGQEIPAHDPLYEPGLGLVYIVNSIPGRHDQVLKYLPLVGFDVGPLPDFGTER